MNKIKAIVVISAICLLIFSLNINTKMPTLNPDLKKAEEEVSTLIDDDWLDMVKNGKTLDFCSSFIIKTYHQLSLLKTKSQTTNDFIPQLAKEKIYCLDSPEKTTLALLSKRAKKILTKYKISSDINNKWLKMRPYYIDRALYKAVANDNLALYLSLLAYGANYANTAIAHSIDNVALSYQANTIIAYLLKTEQIGFNWTTNGGAAPLALLIDHKKVRHDLLEYALKKANANPNYNGELRRYPIDVAVENGDAKSVEILIKYGAKINLNSFNDFYCERGMLLDKAIQYKNKEVINALIMAGAETYEECKKK